MARQLFSTAPTPVRHICVITLSFCHTVILSFRHSIILSYCYSVIPSYSHIVILSFYHTFIPSFCHTVILSYSDACYTDISASITDFRWMREIGDIPPKSIITSDGTLIIPNLTVNSHIHVYTCKCTWSFECVCECMYVCVYMCVCECMYVCVSVYVYYYVCE